MFLAGERAYKLKKPLVLPFVDYGTPARRRNMCREEVRLNRRLSHDIYLGVKGVAATDSGFRLTDDDDPDALDYVVEMRRYDENQTAAAKLARGELDHEDVLAIARTIAAFHQAAPPVKRRGSPALAAQHRFERNLHELLDAVEQRGEIDRLLALQRFAHSFVASHSQTFQGRAREHHIRDGHGDLRAEHVLLEDEVQIVDCVEFDRSLRELDQADDLAFLVLDLVAATGDRFTDLLLRTYRDAGGDPGDDALLAFYACYRALVRAKVALVRARELPAESAPHGQQSAHARDLIGLAERFAWRARTPLVLVVCGLPASGKSELAHELAERSGLPHLSSDLTRKRLAAVAPTDRAPQDVYSDSFSALTYSELGRRARAAVSTRRGAILDATFRRCSDRAAFAEAFAAAAAAVFIECNAPIAVLARRATRRERDRERVSDADAAVVLREAKNWEPLDEIDPSAHISLRTDRPLSQVVSDVLALLDQRLSSFVQ